MPISSDALAEFLARAIRSRRGVSDAARATIGSIDLSDAIGPSNLAEEIRTREAVKKLERFLELIDVSKFAAMQQQVAFAREFALLIQDYSPEEQEVANTYLQTKLMVQILKEVAELDACAEVANTARSICNFIQSCRGRFEVQGSQVLFLEDCDLENYQGLCVKLQQAHERLRAFFSIGDITSSAVSDRSSARLRPSRRRSG
jgi:hypothetical protein